MTAKKLFLFCLFFLCQIICAQNDTIVALKEVIVSDLQLKKFSKTQSISVLSDTIIKKNAASLTSLLNYNSVIYFKENGLGMVSSPSFRGTTAQQTALIWNGININSQLNGQTDFNTITTKDFNNITIRAGGGSSIYGSSAIGGSIHLTNELLFENQFQNELFLNYGSFNTFGTNYKMTFSNKKFASQISVSRNSSDNNYKYLNTNLKNENGQFYNSSTNLTIGYQLNKNNYIKMYSQFFESERHFSRTIYSNSYSKYQDLNTRNLAEWNVFNSKINSSLKIAYLSEQYKYFENFNSKIFETSKAETFIGKYDLSYTINKKINLNSIFEYSKVKGFGKNIGENIRNTKSILLLFNHSFFENFGYSLSLKRDYVTDFESPILYSFGTHYKANRVYKLKFTISKNFRAPSFNDLYWISGGNPDLKPETSLNAELGQELAFGKFYFKWNTYYNKMKNLILWIPTNGNWSPENVTDVFIYGEEIMASFIQKNKNSSLNIDATYAYTVSENSRTQKQLTFVPFHKFNINASYYYKKLGIHYQHLYNGYVFILSDNNDYLKGYQVANFNIDYEFGKKRIYKIGLQTLNIWNENYQNVPSRPLPGRNFNLLFNIII